MESQQKIPPKRVTPTFIKPLSPPKGESSKVVKRVAPIFIKPLSPPKPVNPSKGSPKKRTPPKVQKPFGAKTEGQMLEYEVLKRSKVLGPLLLKDEKSPLKDPLAAKSSPSKVNVDYDKKIKELEQEILHNQKTIYGLTQEIKSMGKTLKEKSKKSKSPNKKAKSSDKSKKSKTLEKTPKKSSKKTSDRTPKSKKCEKKDKVFCAKIHVGQGGRQYIKVEGKNVYLKKPIKK